MPDFLPSSLPVILALIITPSDDFIYPIEIFYYVFIIFIVIYYYYLFLLFYYVFFLFKCVVDSHCICGHFGSSDLVVVQVVILKTITLK
jgi:hypothetical protein